jgi:MFS transporter, DHA3 family, macrolide efflux protein
VYLIVAAWAVLGSLAVPAFSCLTPLMVPERHIGRANGLRMLAMAFSELVGPVAAGFLLLGIGIKGLVLMDLASYGAALLTLVLVRVPRARPEQESAGGVRALLTEFRDGWRYVAARSGLLGLLLFLGALSFSAGYIDLLFRPLVLDFASPAALGVVMSCGGLGMIIAGGAMSVWGGPRRRVRVILGLSFVLAVATVIGSARPSVVAIAVAAFLFMAAMALILTINQGIWQTKVEPHMLGRAMAVQNIVASVPQIIAYATAGFIADRVFGPLVGVHQVRSAALAVLVGHGAGRGTALLTMTMGLVIALTAGIAAMSPRLRRLEDELPDVVREEAVPEEKDGEEQDGAVDSTPSTVSAAREN